MDGWWDANELDEFFFKVLSADVEKKVLTPSMLIAFIKAKLTNRQTKDKSKEVAEKHYDLGNDLYEHMLDKRMQYTCAYWREAKTLYQAQIDKLHLICRKLELKKGMTVLELGGGFGGLARFMAKEYGCIVTSYNISKAQIAYARKICEGLPVTLIEADYREASGEFDRVVSIGLCEHVGYKNYRSFLEVAHRSLKDGGIFLLHTIGRNTAITFTDPWIDKYIFPNGMVPSIAQLSVAMEGLFIMEDWHNFGPDYDKTLMQWHKNFKRNWPKIKEHYDERFYRMWAYYLMASAGAFRARKLQLWQIVLSKGRLKEYVSVR
jgi:cyclopropane-fatty-acyl-phospholipid synthase